MHLPCSCKLPLELLLLLDTISFATTTRNTYDYCYCFHHHHHPLLPRGVFWLFDAFFPNEKPSSKIGQIKVLLSKISSRFSLYNVFFWVADQAQVEDQIHQLKEELQQRKAAQVRSNKNTRSPDWKAQNHVCNLVHVLRTLLLLFKIYFSWVLFAFEGPEQVRDTRAKWNHFKNWSGHFSVAGEKECKFDRAVFRLKQTKQTKMLDVRF